MDDSSVKILIRQIKQSVVDGELIISFELSAKLIDKINDSKKEEEYLIIKARFKNLEKDVLLGILPYEKFDNRRNQIVQSLLKWLRYIEEKAGITHEDIDQLTPQDRTKEIVYRAKDIFELYGGAVVRERAVYTSFSIPNREINDPIWTPWKNWQGVDQCLQLAQQRHWLEKHVADKYCRLIIKPIGRSFLRKTHPDFLVERLKVLLDFITTYKSRTDVVAYHEPERFDYSNSIIIGDRFYAESNKIGKKGWKETSITSKDVKNRIETFDDEFFGILNKRGWDIFKAKEEAIMEIEKAIKVISREAN